MAKARHHRDVFCLGCGWKGSRAESPGWAADKGKTAKPCPKCRRAVLICERTVR